MAFDRVMIPNNSKTVVTALGLLEGERYLLRRVVYETGCEGEVGVVDYRPNCCRIYLGECNGIDQANTGNPIMFDTTPTGGDMAGTYEFVPDGIFADPDGVSIYAEVIKDV